MIIEPLEKAFFGMVFEARDLGVPGDEELARELERELELEPHALRTLLDELLDGDGGESDEASDEDEEAEAVLTLLLPGLVGVESTLLSADMVMSADAASALISSPFADALSDRHVRLCEDEEDGRCGESRRRLRKRSGQKPCVKISKL